MRDQGRKEKAAEASFIAPRLGANRGGAGDEEEGWGGPIDVFEPPPTVEEVEAVEEEMQREVEAEKEKERAEVCCHPKSRSG